MDQRACWWGSSKGAPSCRCTALKIPIQPASVVAQAGRIFFLLVAAGSTSISLGRIFWAGEGLAAAASGTDV
jgi:hypothetical protein